MDVEDMTTVSDVTHFVQQQAEFTADESNCQQIEEYSKMATIFYVSF